MNLTDRPLLVRWPTQDIIAISESLEENVYALPKRFADDDVIIDVGAHIGAFAAACLIRGCGKVICYEPEDSNFELLERNMRPWGEQVEVHHAAVMDKTGEVGLKRAGASRFTAMHQTLGYGQDQLVPCVGLADILQKVDRVRLVKLDCEGAEVPILNAVRDMSKVRQVVGEMHYKCVPNGGRPPSDGWLKETLARLGFKVMKIVGGNHDPDTVANFWAWRDRSDADGTMADRK